MPPPLGTIFEENKTKCAVVRVRVYEVCVSLLVGHDVQRQDREALEPGRFQARAYARGTSEVGVGLCLQRRRGVSGHRVQRYVC